MTEVLSYIFIPLIVLILFVGAFILLRTARFPRPAPNVPPLERTEVDGEKIAGHLGEAIRIRTISNLDLAANNGSTFHELHRLLERLYPKTHATLHREVVNEYSLLYSWVGREPDLEPVLLASHQDVVPVEEGSLNDWIYPPFEGRVADGFVWGRGSMDIKCGVIGILEAVEHLIETGFQPERTIYLAFGHDEELGGKNGASAIVQMLKSRGVTLASVLDEGTAVMENMLPGVKVPVALISTGEKGYLSLELSSESPGGHSAMPPEHTAVGKIAKAIHQLETNPFPAHKRFIVDLFRNVGSDLPFGLQLIFANLWLFGGLAIKKLEASPAMNATLRTTLAATMIEGGIKDNILPRKARAVVNCRILPGEDLRSTYEHVMESVNNGEVSIKPLGSDTLEGISGWDPSAAADLANPMYICAERVVRQVFPQAAVAPFLMLGATDSRHYAHICPCVLRFAPYQISADDIQRVHGVNERLSLENCEAMVVFYMAYLRECAG